MAVENAQQNSFNSQAKRAPPALDIERVALTQPYKDFLGKGWITSIEVSMTPGGSMVKCTLGPEVKTDKNVKDIAPGVAKMLIVESGLWTPGQKGKASKPDKPAELPKRSLVPADFDGKKDEALRARVTSVADAIGAERARGRIGSLRLMSDGVDTFKKWWKTQNPESRARLLTDKKSFDKLSASHLARLSEVVVDCPFPGPVPTPKEEEEEGEQSDGEEAPKASGRKR